MGDSAGRLPALSAPSASEAADPDPWAATGELNPPAVSSVQDREATFEAFCRERYAKLVGAVRVMVSDRDLAEDIVQETLARAYLNWRKLWPDGNPGGWCYRVAVNLAVGWHRRAAREARALARLARRTESVPPPQSHPELARAVAALPPRQRAAVALHYTLGLSVEEAAAAMRCRPGTVKSLLHAARERLRRELGEEA